MTLICRNEMSFMIHLIPRQTPVVVRRKFTVLISFYCPRTIKPEFAHETDKLASAYWSGALVDSTQPRNRTRSRDLTLDSSAFEMVMFFTPVSEQENVGYCAPLVKMPITTPERCERSVCDVEGRVWCSPYSR